MIRVTLALAWALGLSVVGLANTDVAHATTWQDVVLRPQKAAVAGTSIAYAQWGQGPPLLLLNGTGSPMSEWDPALLAGLGTTHRVTVFDYPGLGLSGPSPGEWTFTHAADWTAALIDATQPGQRVDVLGWSMGGFVAQQLAVRHPELIRRLVLAGTNPGGPQAVLGPTWVQQADSDANASIATFLRTDFPHTSAAQRAGRAFISRLTTAVDSGAYPAEDVPAATYDAMVAAEDPWLASGANAAALTSVTIPTLIITGARDVVTPPINSRRIAALIPGSRLVLVPRAGHAFLFQDPAGTAVRVISFLAEPV